MKNKKEEIYNFLKENVISFNQKELHRKTGIAYCTILRWIPELEREGKVIIKEYYHKPSNMKVVKAV